MKQTTQHAIPNKLSLWAIDERALGLFRIALAILLLLEWIDRWTFRDDFISAFGLTPATLTISRAGHYSLADIFLFTNNSNLVNLYLIFGLISYLFLLLGYFSKIACTCSLLFYSSLLISNPAIRNFGDHVVVLALLWGVFAGLGSRFSFDSIYNVATSKSYFGKQVIFVQFVLIVLGAGLAKTGETWRNGSALAYVLSSPVVTSSFGQIFDSRSPFFLKRIFCWSSLLIEVLCPILLLIPVVPILLRRLSVALLACLWIGISIFLSIGIGPWLMLTSTLLFLDKGLLDLLMPSTAHKDKLVVNNSSFLTVVQLPLIIIAFAMFLNFAVGTRFPLAKKELPAVLLIPFSLLGVTQDWIMFAPDPYMIIQWPQIVAKLKDGREVDIISGKVPDFTRIVLPDTLPRIKRKYFEFLGKTENSKYRTRLLQVLCKNSDIFSKIGSEIISAQFVLIKKKLHANEVVPDVGPIQPNLWFDTVEKIECPQ